MFGQVCGTPSGALTALLPKHGAASLRALDVLASESGATVKDVEALAAGDLIPTASDVELLSGVARGAGVGVGTLAFQAPMTRQRSFNESSPSDGRMLFVMSTAGVDRYADIVRQDFDLEAFSRNLVAPWNHDYSETPVGKWEDVRVNDGQLMGLLRFDESELNERGRLVAHQFREGFLSAVSVGFLPGKATRRASLADGDEAKADAGFIFESNHLLEASPVTVPGNAEALLVGRRLGSAFVRSVAAPVTVTGPLGWLTG